MGGGGLLLQGRKRPSILQVAEAATSGSYPQLLHPASTGKSLWAEPVCNHKHLQPKLNYSLSGPQL